MGKNFTTAFALCLAISALPLACGDDEDDDGGKGGKGNTGGSAGSSTGGRAGSSTGGRAGSGGATTGGRAGSGGATTGGSAGSATGGMGGAEGGMGGDDGGMGGEGGMVEPPMTPCEQVCEGPPGDCAATCVTEWCADLNANPGATCDPIMAALYTCFAADNAAGSWVCTQGVPQYGGTECYDEYMAAYAGACLPL